MKNILIASVNTDNGLYCLYKGDDTHYIELEGELDQAGFSLMRGLHLLYLEGYYGDGAAIELNLNLFN